MTTLPVGATAGTPMVAASDYRAMMAKFPSGVSVVTAYAPDGTPRGMTCSAVCSVTLEPPTLLACLRNDSPTLAAVLAARAFTVNLLHERARSAAVLFGSGDPGRFDRAEWSRTAMDSGPGLFADAHAVADCHVAAAHRIGSHTVVFGEVQHITLDPTRRPLLYGMREYAAWPLIHL
ncbi:flavin reductase family protein [Streptomyces sp. RB6PN25]|uniref:Flavin reductase family protein n=1 Tax=Streptomyces humicola TaxID=2953240 RepID=A0ABT1Q600_9ACTN|nr:flavin reductase family protein [Streptomyces humicola]MCQ4084245.1 flavin reductase family protein [Streptomyces humicola]